ncbi:MAG: hypothetical protein A4S16_01585 [Proteobacteria bacterium SG_bin6]|nr:MAG: hypothetical protein A4S16_01585 [Proteobacteria bacterium SG_bin6]
MARLRIKTQLLVGETIALGPGKAELLEAIGREGSISAAARAMGLSYRRAWLMIDATNRAFAEPLVALHPGARIGATLTEEGRAVVTAYRALEAALAETGERHGRAILDRLRAATEGGDGTNATDTSIASDVSTR